MQKKSVPASSWKTNPLNTFLQETRSQCKLNPGDEKKYTHTSIDKPKGSYFIPEENMDTFWDLYHQVVFKDGVETHLTERVSDLEYTPFKIDIDLRYYAKDANRVYTNEDINEICKLYMREMNVWFQPLDDEEREFFILEKSKPTFDMDRQGNKKLKEGTTDMFRIKDGIHIITPFIVHKAVVQHKVRQQVYEKVGAILDKYNFDSTYAEIFDEAVIHKNNWQLYGSRKPYKEAYKLTRIIRVWEDSVEEMQIDKYTDRQLIELLSMRNKNDESHTAILHGQMEEIVYHLDCEADKLSANRKKRLISKKKKLKNQRKLKKDDIALVCNYVDCLKVERANSYNSWIEVGWCLHNLHNKDDTLLKKWIEFSKKPSNRAHEAESACKDYWENMCCEGLGIASLKLWAKEDNPEKYYKVLQKDNYKCVMDVIKIKKGSSYDVAKLMYNMFSDYHKCVSIKDTAWYYYDEKQHRWKTDDKGVMLRRKISEEVYREFKKVATIKTEQSSEAGDDAHEDVQKLFAVMARLKETSFKANIMTECAEIFYDKEHIFIDLLDSNNNLIGFNNCVYDLIREEYRKGRPEDYISLSTKIDYVPYEDVSESRELAEINDMLRSIFVIKEIREYVMTRLSSFLSGSTKDEHFDVFSGGGGNGKSKIMELLEKAAGDYCCKLPISLLTSKRAASNAATPELANTKGKRIASLQEPDTETSLNVGLMKELTGGDTIQARALFKEPIEFKPQFKLILCCNDKPKLPEHDEGTWRRVRNTDFVTAFRHEPEEDRVLQFKIDESLSEHFNDWVEPFMSLLIQYHKQYRKNGLHIPDEIHEYTNEYRATGSHFVDFANDRLEEDPTNKKTITMQRAYDAYKRWYTDNHADKNWKNRKQLQAYLDEKFKTKLMSGSKNKHYIGVSEIEISPVNIDSNYVNCMVDELDD